MPRVYNYGILGGVYHEFCSSGATMTYTFSSTHGAGVTVSDSNKVITTVGQDHAMAYTDTPILIGKPFVLKVLKSGFIVSSLISLC